jgi:hypothetical protein
MNIQKEWDIKNNTTVAGYLPPVPGCCDTTFQENLGQINIFSQPV